MLRLKPEILPLFLVPLLVCLSGCAGFTDARLPSENIDAGTVASELKEVQVGQSVKVQLLSGVIVPGKVLACDSEKIVIAPRGWKVESVEYKRSEIARIQVETSRDQTMLIAVVVGTLALGVVGLLIGRSLFQ